MTAEPRQDLVEASLMFRCFALEHPALFSIAFHRVDPTIWPRFQTAAMDALVILYQRFEPLAAQDLLGGRSVSEAAWQFHALCEGLAGLELRGTPLGGDPETLWRDAVHALVNGFANAKAPPRTALA